MTRTFGAAASMSALAKNMTVRQNVALETLASGIEVYGCSLPGFIPAAWRTWGHFRDVGLELWRLFCRCRRLPLLKWPSQKESWSLGDLIFYLIIILLIVSLWWAVEDCGLSKLWLLWLLAGPIGLVILVVKISRVEQEVRERPSQKF